jgi:hypothetical protein
MTAGGKRMRIEVSLEGRDLSYDRIVEMVEDLATSRQD